MNQTEIASGCGVCMDDQCATPLCSTSFGYDENYSISVTAFNSFGSLPPAIFSETIGTMIYLHNIASTFKTLATHLYITAVSSLFNHTLTFENCVTSVLCSSPMDEGGCVIQYGLNSSQDLGPSVSIPLNTLSTLPNIDSSTQYYFTINVTVGSTSFQLRRTLTTGEGMVWCM